MSFIENPNKAAMPLTDLYQEYGLVITPGKTAVVVGPSTSIFHDATLLLTLHLLRNDGVVYVVDPQSRSDPRYNDEIEKAVGGPVKGIGNVERHFAEIGFLKQEGMQLATPQWLGPESGAQKIILSDNSVDVIVDHNTSVFLGGLPSSSDWKLRRLVLTACYSEYQRILKPDGNILLQTDSSKYGLIGTFLKKDLLTQLLHEHGFLVDQKQVQDIVTIPLKEPILHNILQAAESPIPGRENLYFLKSRLWLDNERYFVQFKDQDHTSTDLYIATKESTV